MDWGKNWGKLWGTESDSFQNIIENTLQDQPKCAYNKNIHIVLNQREGYHE